MNFGSRTLASGLLSSVSMRWVGALAGAVVATSCLLPQDDQVLQDWPTKNHPPYFTGTGVLEPPFKGQVKFGDGCKTQEFKITVNDPDQDDLRVRCFLDPSSDLSSGTLFEGELKPPGPPPSVATCTLPVTNNIGLGAQGSHYVKMVVADGELHGEIAQPRPVTLSDGGILRVSTYAISYLWPVISDPVACPDGGL